MNLIVDIGNTRIKAALFEGSTLISNHVWQETETTNFHLWLRSLSGVSHVLMSSVAAPDAALEALLRERFHYTEFTNRTPLPFKNAYGTPETLGKDRLAAVAGAFALFPGQNCLVIDCGTCIKYDLILKDGVYIGGNIAPGAHMRLEAMHHFTARLPLVPLELPPLAHGTSTQTALQNGGIRGALLEIDGFIRLFKKRYRPLKIILTGGDASFFLPHLANHKPVFEANLVMIGINSTLITQHPSFLT